MSRRATQPMHIYEVRPRKDKRGVDLISDALLFVQTPLKAGTRTLCWVVVQFEKLFYDFGSKIAHSPRL
jgi:hypothetical protein